MATAMARTTGRLAIAACAAGLAAACAMPATSQQQAARAAASDSRQCFNAQMVNGFNPVDQNTVRVTVGANTVYELETVGHCPQIDWSQSIGIRTVSGQTWVCHGFDAELVVPSMMGDRVDRCPVTGIRLVTPQELQAERARRR